MHLQPNVAAIASLLSDQSRATILTSLMDGRFHTASELAYMAAITPQTASFHLAKLTDAHLILLEKHGRHHYFKLADEEVAHIIESFLAISPPPEVRSLKQSSQLKLLQNARTCYDHLAGKLGVDITQTLLNNGYLKKNEREFVITSNGEHFFANLGLDVHELKRRRRSFSHACLDWSERCHHLAGSLGNGLFQHLLDSNWIIQVPSIRAIKVTEKGRVSFKEIFDLQV